ncbi:MAG TPA: hypothetical protein VGG95_14875 [Edaphobacter sp.]|jgi:hypothetical protein
MSRIRVFARILSVLLFTSSLFAFGQQWMTGKLVDTERQEVHSGSTTTYNSDSKKKNGNYSENGTSRTTDDTDVYQVFTLQTADRTYVVRQKLNFPWSKPANITVGEDVKFTVQGNKVVILDNDQKQQKASVVKATANQ